MKPSRYFLMENKPLTEAQKKKRKKIKRLFAVSISIMIGIIFSIVMIDFNEVETWWIKVTGDHTYGIPVYKSAVHEDIKVTITHVAADNYQTILYYEVENLNEVTPDLFYYIHNFDVIAGRIWLNSNQYHYSEPSFNTETKSTGRMFLPPIRNEEEEITVKVSAVEKDSQKEFMYYSETYQSISGSWEITVPIVKQESKVYVIDETVDIDGRSYHFSELEVSPTGTFLSYDTETSYISDGKHEYNYLQFGPLQVNKEKEISPAYYYRGMHSSALESSFDSIYYEEVEEIAITINYLVKTVDFYDTAAPLYVMNIEELPTTITYFDSNVIIEDRSDERQVLGVVMEDYRSRAFDHLYIHINPLLEQPMDNLYADVFPSTMWIDRDGVPVAEDETPTSYWGYHHWMYSTLRNVAIDYTIQFEIFDRVTDNVEIEAIEFMIYGHMQTIPINQVITVPVN